VPFRPTIVITTDLMAETAAGITAELIRTTTALAIMGATDLAVETVIAVVPTTTTAAVMAAEAAITTAIIAVAAIGIAEVEEVLLAIAAVITIGWTVGPPAVEDQLGYVVYSVGGVIFGDPIDASSDTRVV
jgi:hypothetical protein